MKPGAWMLALGLGAALAAQASACPHHGNLDPRYCDANRDMLADPPTDRCQWRDPATLRFAYSPTPDAAGIRATLKPLTDHLARCTGKSVKASGPPRNLRQLKGRRVAHTGPWCAR